MRCSRKFTSLVASLVVIASGVLSAHADETLVSSVDLPGASLSQEVTYSPTKAEYDRVRDETLARLKKGDLSARVNPTNGPWMRVETTAKIGFSVKGVGVSNGTKTLRQITAAEEALFRLENNKE